jgi:hypothetical protein
MSPRATGALLLALLALAATTYRWRFEDRQHPRRSFVVFDENGETCPIYLRAGADPEELNAARFLQRGLAKAAGRHPSAFPIRTWERESRGILLEGSGVNNSRRPSSFDFHQMQVSQRGVVLSYHPRRAAEATAAWFLEQAVGANWFMPGPIGESVPQRGSLRFPLPGEIRKFHAPSFAHRNLGVGGGSGQETWWRANKLHSPLRHGHAMSELFPPEAVRANPDLAPLIQGAKRIPDKADQGWQPNIAAPAAAPQAAKALMEFFTKNPQSVSAAIGLNDNINFDQSEATRAQMEPARWFRGEPDFSDLYFRFANEVARRSPDRLLGAYAYDWTEQVPRMRVERNVIPWLTSDKAQWFDRDFAAEDKDLIKRWLNAGPEIVGVYDYYEGWPFLVPRPTLYAVKESIPFLHQAGVKAFYAEGQPNWGLDGPKHWLAAQLLWDARQDPDKLLDTYYREFWQEAAEPMRRFFETCERQWLTQPKPSYWLKYFKDEHHYLLFPPEVRMRLGAALADAAAKASQRIVRRRVDFSLTAFTVFDAFCEFNERREELARTLLDHKPSEAAIEVLAVAERDARARLKTVHAEAQRRHPLAIQGEIYPGYLRHDPAAKLAATGAASGEELLVDRGLRGISIKPAKDFFAREWVLGEHWRGRGDPFETRELRLVSRPEDGNAMRMAGCQNDALWQWVPAEAGSMYQASARVQAKVSPGSSTFLLLNFADREGKTMGLGVSDRLPVGDWSHGVELRLAAKAPPAAHFVGIGVIVSNQVNADFAEFSGFSLKRVDQRR